MVDHSRTCTREQVRNFCAGRHGKSRALLCMFFLCLFAVVATLPREADAATAITRNTGPINAPETLPEGWKTYIIRGGASFSLPNGWVTRKADSKKPNILFQANFREDNNVLAGIQVLLQPLPKNLLGIDHNAAFEKTSEATRHMPYDQVKRSLAGSGFDQIVVHEARYLKLNGRAARLYKFSYTRNDVPLTTRKVEVPGKEHMVVVVLFGKDSLGEQGAADLDRVISTFSAGDLQ